jgi:predicted ATPase/DNA-binding SARP family transcriptional activator
VQELKLTLLGSPGLEFGGAPVEADTRKALALVAYLALTKRRHGRDALAAFLWPEYAQSRARAALRRTLAALGEARSGCWLEARRESLGVTGEGLWVDVDRFRELLAACREHAHPENEVCDRCLPPLEEAAAVYRDDFMAGFTLRDSAAFDDWQFFQAEELRRELAGALERLARGHSERGAWETAMSYARRWLSLDPLHEPAHRALMQIYAASGRRSAALRQYRVCVRTLERELGVAPLSETAALYETIKEDRPRSAAHLPPPEPPPTAEPAMETFGSRLVGRDREWSALLAAYAATGPDGYVVALEGEAGIGKTRLAEEFLTHAGERSARTLAARCYEGESSLAYGPLVETLGSAVRQPDALLQEVPGRYLTEAARLLPELSERAPGLPAAPPLGGPGAQSRFYEGVCETLLALCRGPAPGVVLFDDLHWADEASVDLLTYLIRRLHERPILVLFTWRSEQVREDHRLRRLLAETRRAERATAIELRRLPRESVYELARQVAGYSSEELGARLYEETEGVPLFLREYLTAVARDAPERSGDRALPGGVRDLLHGRLQEASETGRQLLAAAAAVGRSTDLDTLREASGRGEEETIAAVEELVGRNLLRETRDSPEESPSYDFSHEKLRALVYEETGLARRRLLHRRIADTLLERARRRRETGSLSVPISYHLRLAGREQEAARYLVLAGEHARSVYANAEALDHLRAALALGHPQAADLHESLGDLHTLLGEYGAALASYETAAALRDPEEEPGGLARLEQKLGGVHQRRGDWEQADSHLEAALDAAEGAPAADLARLYADRSLSARHLDRSECALELANRALELATQAEDQRALARAHNALGILHRDAGNSEHCREHLTRSLALAQRLEDPGARVAALNNLALALAENGERDAALALLREALSLCAAQGDRHREAALHNNLADLLHDTGRTEDSMQHLKRAVSIFAEVGGEGELQPEIWKLTEW